MKRTVPLLITAIGGFVLFVAFFIPETEDWGEKATIWFDILAAIAFVLGGGNLLKIHLKKISDRAAGWGYSAITLMAFLTTLYFGLAKTGSQPAPDQEAFGETAAPLPLDALPEALVFRTTGSIPRKADGQRLPDSVLRQLTLESNELAFRGWMAPNQKQDLLKFQDELDWQCTVERFFDKTQPEPPLTGVVRYEAAHQSLVFSGVMTDEQKKSLEQLSMDKPWTLAVEHLWNGSRRTTELRVDQLPAGFQVPTSLAETLVVDADGAQIRLTGPMSTQQRDALAAQFPAVRPYSPRRRDELLFALEAEGSPLSEGQLKAFKATVDGIWTAEQLRAALDNAGQAPERNKTACEMLEEMRSGVREIIPTASVGEDVSLNDAQVGLVTEFAEDPTIPIDELVARMKQAGPFESRQEQALAGFLRKNPTAGEWKRTLYLALLRKGPLTAEQRDFLVEDFRTQVAWRKRVGELFLAAHVPKYPWSGNYREQGNPFWWLYEYAFKPLTATMFAMLAFYVASAAFRAFRAKNLEAILLLGTAFIILLGRTFAGVLLTSWFPEEIAGLRIENLAVYIMQVFNTAGTRAIMIGIALGIASTSLKVLLGIDRSYLGSREE